MWGKFCEVYAPKSEKKKVDEKPIGVCLGWDGKPHLCFSDGKYLPNKAEKLLYPEWICGDWFCNPETNERLPIYEVKT